MVTIALDKQAHALAGAVIVYTASAISTPFLGKPSASLVLMAH